MEKVGVREARDRIGHLLNAVQAGEDVVIMRHGKPAARLVRMEVCEPHGVHFPDRSAFRARQPGARRASADLIGTMRDERG